MENRAKIIVEAATEAARKKISGLTDSTEQGFGRAKAAATRASEGTSQSFQKANATIKTSAENTRKEIADLSNTAEKEYGRCATAAKKFGDGMNSALQKAKAAWVEITATVLALRKAYNMADSAARFKERETAFANMAASHGADASRIIADLNEMSGQTIDTMTLMEKAGTAMTLGIQADKLDDLMRIARASAKITGQTVAKAYEDIALAVGRQSRMILDNLGIIVKVEGANEKYAAQLGKVSSELTDAEKKQAFLNATLEAGNDIIRRVGTETVSASERLQQWRAGWKDTGIVIGRFALSVTQIVEVAFRAAGVTVNRAISGWSRLISETLKDLATLPVIGERIGKIAESLKAVGDNAKAASDYGLKKMSDTWDTMKSLWTKSEPVMGRINQAIEDQGKKAKETSEKVKDLFDKFKKDAETRSEATKAMYRESGINADAYYRDEVNQLVRKVKAWQDAGANIAATESYLFERIEDLEKDALNKGAQFAADWLGQMKHHTDTMVADLAEKDADIHARFQNIANSIADLDGSEIGIHARLYDEPLVEGIDNLIRKLQHLTHVVQATPAAVPSTGDGASGSGAGTTIVNNFDQSISRSDAASIATEQARMADRG